MLMNIKNVFKKNIDVAAVFAATFIIFYLVQFSFQGIAENDSHLYIKLAKMTIDNGIIREFPWMYTSTMNSNFTGLHFLYYFLLIPFTFLGDLVFAAKIASVFFIAALFSVIYGILKDFGLRLKLLWFVFFISSSGYFLFRMNATRPLSLSVILYLLIFYALIKKNKKLLFVASFLSVWAHGSFPIVLFLVIAFVMLEYVRKKSLNRESLIYSIGGLMAALFINPFFPNNFTTYFSTYFSPAIPYSLTSQISEWQPLGMDMIFSDSSLLFFAEIILAFILIASHVLKFISGFKNEIFFEEDRSKRIAIELSLFMSLSFMVMTFLVGRFIDYWIPFAIIFIALYFESLYFKLKKIKAWEEFDGKKFLLISGEDLKFAGSAFLIIAVFSLAQARLSFVREMMSNAALFGGALKENALWLKYNTPQNSIVLNINWGDFSRLFFYNSHNYYTLGLDPKFMYNVSAKKYWAYEHLKEKIVCGEEKCDNENADPRSVYEIMKEEFDASYVFIPVDPDFDYSPLINKLGSDKNFEKVFQNEAGQIWALK